MPSPSSAPGATPVVGASPRWVHLALRTPPWTTLGVTALAGASMVCYPGGTVRDPGTRRYQLAHNFLSDLGMTVAHNGRPNALGAALFAGAMVLMVAGFGATLAAFLALYARPPGAPRFTRAAVRLTGALGLVVALAFGAVGFTPENAVLGLHVRVTLLAFFTVPLVIALLGVAARGTDARHATESATWTLLAVALAAYAALLHWGPPVDTGGRLTMYVVAQKAITVGATAVFLLQARRARARLGRPTT